MSRPVQRIFSVAIMRWDERELEYEIGDPNVSEGLSFHPPWGDPPPPYSDIFDGAGNVGGVIARGPVWDDRVRWGGSNNFQYRISGIVVDSGGSPVTNAVCSLFRASDDAWMYDTVSSSGGQYDFGVGDTTTKYYVVARRSDLSIAGATVDTLTGA